MTPWAHACGNGGRHLQPSDSKSMRIKLRAFERSPVAAIPPSEPLLGLLVAHPDACTCGAKNASLHCGGGRHRRWLPHLAYSVLANIVDRFRRPTEPPAIR